ncbi:PEP-CTERM/exosortase system-associated acyltransferase [Geobacter argillaceus]|uniref:N-acyl amino acid synthase of PEP-CTERM/exosortase system n=1 Tax=Geobacter argillaceus TaxID=345631 RepID=A0A562V780_9BACT|nr:PEP-CTERM/exosortase system-associated acyltransferase [Geobacter argillaceus]TWJ13765.1 N-acyl amino acid synthase of PEP-CTERM/exosortase system [Geobacter argillaceus]
MLLNTSTRNVTDVAEGPLGPYKLLPVATSDQLQKAFQLRYQVYCVEKQYESCDRSLGMEFDAFDDQSVHTLLVDSQENAVGNVRLILPKYKQLDQSFPIQKICNHKMLHDRQFIFGGAAEVSRFAISKSLGGQGQRVVPSLPVLSLGLMRGVVRMSREHGVDELFAVMEPALIRLLARLSIHFIPIGPLIDYHGMRQPCHANLTRQLQRTEAENPAVWAFITDEGNYAGHSTSPMLANYC